MSFKIGEKVVCINDVKLVNKESIKAGNKAPVKNEIYTIKEFINDGPSCTLLEIPTVIYETEHGKKFDSFYLYHFRKLDYDFAENLLAEIKESIKYQLS